MTHETHRTRRLQHIGWREAVGTLATAPLLASCMAGTHGNHAGNATHPTHAPSLAPTSAEALPAAPSIPPTPDCRYHILSAGILYNVAMAGPLNAWNVFRDEDIDGADIVSANGGPKNVKIIEFTGSAALSPEQTGDASLINTEKMVEQIAAELGFPSENVDLRGETRFQSGNGGVKTAEQPGTVAIISAQASHNSCNIVAYPNGN